MHCLFEINSILDYDCIDMFHHDCFIEYNKNIGNHMCDHCYDTKNLINENNLNGNIKYENEFFHNVCFINICKKRGYHFCANCHDVLTNLNNSIDNTIFSEPHKYAKYVCDNCFINAPSIEKCGCSKGVRQKCFYYKQCNNFANHCEYCKHNIIDTYCDWCK